MRAIRRSIILTAALGMAAAIGFAGPAAAQGYAGPTIVVVAVTGDTANVSGNGWQPGALITVTINSDPVVLGTINASATGSFSQNYQIPCLENGTHTITASGIAEDGLPRTSSDVVSIQNCVISTGAANLAFTGSSDTFPFVGVGIGLILAGAVLAVVAQRRRSAHSISA
jgi:hypothetical protein